MQTIREAGGSALAIETDVTDQEQSKAIVQHTVDTLGRLDIVVNNAGVMLLGRIGDIERLGSEDNADAIAYIVTRHRRTSINELLIRPTEQER